MKKLIIASALIAATAPAVAEVSLSGGVVSDYYYRGSQLGDAGGYAGLEYGAAGFTAGVWAIQDGGEETIESGESGIEYDVYASYGVEVNEELSLSIGYTQYNYNYTKAFESEVNLGAAYGPVALDVAVGEADDGADTEVDYTYAALSGDISNISVLLGSFDADLDGDEGDYMHLEASTSKDLGETGLSLAVTLGHTDPKLDGEDSSEYLFFDLSTDFDL